MSGSSACDVWEVDATPEVLVHGQRSELWGLATNPVYPHVFATACDSDAVVVWSAATRKVS
jgi:echinoderm microtubule-associated protein-like 6